MSAGFESHWSAAWFKARAEQCFRLADGMMQGNDAAEIRAMGKELEAQARLAEALQSQVGSPVHAQANYPTSSVIKRD